MWGLGSSGKHLIFPSPILSLPLLTDQKALITTSLLHMEVRLPQRWLLPPTASHEAVGYCDPRGEQRLQAAAGGKKVFSLPPFLKAWILALKKIAYSLVPRPKGNFLLKKE